MLTEEAHHMFVGQTGVGRVIEKTLQVMRDQPGRDVKDSGAIPIDVIQRYINFWSSSSTDLYGAEISSNSANFFRSGLKGRAYEEKQSDHLALEQTYHFENFVDGRLSAEDVPLRNAMNEVLRDAYVEDCQRGLDRWNKRLAEAGLSERLTLPSKRFYRHIGLYADLPFDAEGRLLERAEWDRRRDEWLPSEKDRGYVANLQKAVREPGQIANWIGKPARGIKGLPFEYQYVRLED
jgi:benzoyl-CoA 2,3-dioxygenase component B